MRRASLQTPVNDRERPTEILLVRHPETLANAHGRFVGSGESPFTERGERQADALVSCIASWCPTLVRTSPRVRARTVAERAAQASDAQLEVDEDLAEIDFGLAEGLTYEETTVRGIEIDLLGGPVETSPFEGGESWRDFLERVVRAASLAEVQALGAAYFPVAQVTKRGGDCAGLG